ncbi:MAG: nicotinate-nucleotide--dimethylbenzimidazole phosphoribosyltransferase [Atopobiaceae bacterium]|nr:nicotinate-nucleotide--dimethylbenzimidazole phosphoribosyltransferase [Atopobiaceae bacterium]
MGSFIDTLKIAQPDARAAQLARERWNAIAKPVGSLGALEDIVVKIAALTGDEHVDVSRRCVAVMCADNGVVAQGVSQCGPEVTASVAQNLARGTSSLCCMCAPLGAQVLAVDMGMFTRLDEPCLLDRRIAAGTCDISQGPAMTRAQALQGIRTGIDLVGELAAQGYRLVGAGEMGIGNTTTATAMACAFLREDAGPLVGRGSGLSDEGLRRKALVINRALEVNAPDADDPLDVLAKLGGFDLAGMCGLFLGGAVHRVPVIVDGLISTVAAYCALRLRPECKMAMLASHVSAEPAAAMLMEQMELRPVVDAGMRLGEGTGTTCLMALLDLALSLYNRGLTFEESAIKAYEVDLW